MNIVRLIDWALRHESLGRGLDRYAFQRAARRVAEILIQDDPWAWAPSLDYDSPPTMGWSSLPGLQEGQAAGKPPKQRRGTGQANSPRLPRGAAWLTQKEVASILRMSERGVREVERRALRKLRNHPALKDLWRQYTGGTFEEQCDAHLTAAEVRALYDLAKTYAELRAVEKVLWIIGINPVV